MIQRAISDYLRNKGIKQTFIVEQTGITQNALSLSLSGKRKLSADEYVKICEALQVPYEFFVTYGSST